MGNLILVFMLGFLGSMILTPLVIRLSHRKGWLDSSQGVRKIHTRPVSRLGGLAVYLPFMLILLGSNFWFDLELPVFFFLGISVVFLTGLIDDFISLSPPLKVFGQVVGIVLLMVSGVVISFFTLPWGAILYLGAWGYPLTFFWMLGITNALNLIDGMDGLSSGIAAIASFTLGVVALQEGRSLAALIAFLLMGTELGFLCYNFPPARIFLGDGGALFAGIVLSTISVQGSLKSTATFTLLVPILVLGIPIFDTFFAIVRRKKNRLPLMSPDEGHLHHRLLKRGYSTRKAVLVFYSISLIFSMVAIFINRYLQNSTYSLLLVLVVVFLFMRWGLQLGVTEAGGEKPVGQS
ncbi:MAG: UDP-GlcNAc:undecaprenyl-phosphate/decaprenyl-phosphate GlcNAc-phosphate transferase [Candidatus Atribacteria bacterium]|jgi:UDP-GlcNAc:undecaprenyl-phosphate GlcNAc-1-phosphate transferase|nr:UDP-GlcNAc:undecaprenyl-phosphate/decaprenyl-phosphate GlcNAc-phosphate transferase [Candidatus Atribacteria bacterium]